MNGQKRQKWHNVHPHHGGATCAKCNKVFFTEQVMDIHNCVPLQSIYVLNEKNDKVIVRQGRPSSRLYALPLKRKSRKSNRNYRKIWVGSSSKKLAKEAANQQLSKCETAKKNKFVKKNGKSEGCSSINRLLNHKIIEKRWTPLPKEAFFFETHGGSHKAIQHLKNFVRNFTGLVGHNKSMGSESMLRDEVGNIFNSIQNMEQLPQKCKNAMTRNYKYN